LIDTILVIVWSNGNLPTIHIYIPSGPGSGYNAGQI
jgi:hypothetical protein